MSPARICAAVAALVAAFCAVIAIGFSYGAWAATTDTASVSGPTAVRVGERATYSGSPCTVVCGQTFNVFGTGYSRLGTPFAGTIVFSRPGNYQVSHVISERCVGSPNKRCKSTAWLYVGVTA
jgi:hypothetical protein